MRIPLRPPLSWVGSVVGGVPAGSDPFGSAPGVPPGTVAPGAGAKFSFTVSLALSANVIVARSLCTPSPVA